MQKKIDLKLLLKLTIPIFLELIFQMLLGSVDKVMVRNDFSANAINQASTILDMLTISMSVLASGSLILISQYKGAKDKESENKIYSIAFFFNVTLGLILGIILVIFAPNIFKMLSVSEDYFEESVLYLRINGGFLILQAAILSLTSFLRSNGHVVYSLVTSIIFNIINVALNALFLYGFKISGAQGVAIGSVIARFIGVIILFVLVKKLIKIKFGFKGNFVSSLKELKKLLRISLPSVGESLSYSVSQVVILSFINIIGLKLCFAAPTARTYTTIMIQFSYVFANSVAQGMQILLGQYLGANEKEKANEIVKKTLLLSIVVSLAISSLQAIFAKYIFSFFTKDEQVISLCQQIMCIEIFLEFGRAINGAMVRALQTSGDVLFPTILAIIFCWIVAVGGGYLFGIVFKFGIAGIWIAMAIDEICRGVIFIIRWKKGKWKTYNLTYSNKNNI